MNFFRPQPMATHRTEPRRSKVDGSGTTDEGVASTGPVFPAQPATVGPHNMSAVC
jgi:hypothetical protein